MRHEIDGEHGYVRFGSRAARRKPTTRAAAIGSNPVAQQRFFESQNLNGSYCQKQPFK
jgi:hypothetical protein